MPFADARGSVAGRFQRLWNRDEFSSEVCLVRCRYQLPPLCRAAFRCTHRIDAVSRTVSAGNKTGPRGRAVGRVRISIRKDDPLIGEVATLHTQFEMFIRALRAAGLEVSAKDAAKSDKEAVGILIRALGSREENTRKLAHRNLVRLTGQDLPPEKEVWEKWYREHRAAQQEGGEPQADD